MGFNQVKAETLREILGRWLKRFSPPKSISEDAEAMADETLSLFGALLRYAPDADYDGWASRVFDRLEYRMKTRAWPTKSELAGVCEDLRRDSGARLPVAHDDDANPLDPFVITGKRMAEGKPVGEGYLWGTSACELIARGLVDEATMKAYRSGAFLSRKAFYGEEPALEWEAERKAEHEKAKQVRADKIREKQDVRIPDMTSPAKGYFA